MTEQDEKSKLSATQMTVTLADGSTLELEPQNPDRVRFDMTRSKHKWPDAESAPILWLTFVAWACARRTGAYAGTWDDWSERDALDIDVADDEADVDPTQTGHGSDSV